MNSSQSNISLLSSKKVEDCDINKLRLDYFFKSCKFLLTNLLLGCVMIVYTILGALLFSALESTNEINLCYAIQAKYNPLINQTINSFWAMGSNYPSNQHKLDALPVIKQLVDDFSSNVQTLGYKGLDCSSLDQPNSTPLNWNFYGSLLFAVTVFTTVGYGNIAPKTSYGRLIVIVYALIGIPLMLVFLANIGEFMAEVFKFIYSNMCCFGCFRCKCPTHRKIKEDLDTNNLEYSPFAQKKDEFATNANDDSNSAHLVPNLYLGPVYKPSYKGGFDGGKMLENTQTEAGFYVAGDNEIEFKSKLASYGNTNELLDKNNLQSCCRYKNGDHHIVDEEIDYVDNYDQTNVPLTITVSIIACYLALGAILFSNWESWDMLTSAYYCFITISTIGFGDVVPGVSNLNTSTGQWQMIGASIYMVLGMAIMSMAFNLIQDEMSTKFNWISETCGLTKNPKEEAYYEQEHHQQINQGQLIPNHGNSVNIPSMIQSTVGNNYYRQLKGGSCDEKSAKYYNPPIPEDYVNNPTLLDKWATKVVTNSNNKK